MNIYRSSAWSHIYGKPLRVITPKPLRVIEPAGDLADARPPAYYGKPLRVITPMVSPFG